VKFTPLPSLPATVSRLFTTNPGERRLCSGPETMIPLRLCAFAEGLIPPNRPALMGVSNSSKPYRLRP